MNRYTAKFFSTCPVNGARIEYTLTIETMRLISVEDLLERLEAVPVALHEEIADHLLEIFGGKQTLVAYHHGVTIETTR